MYAESLRYEINDIENHYHQIYNIDKSSLRGVEVMGNIIMVYASMTGNTAEMAEFIENGIREVTQDLVVKEVVDTSVDELFE